MCAEYSVYICAEYIFVAQRNQFTREAALVSYKTSVSLARSSSVSIVSTLWKMLRYIYVTFHSVYRRVVPQVGVRQQVHFSPAEQQGIGSLPKMIS